MGKELRVVQCPNCTKFSTFRNQVTRGTEVSCKRRHCQSLYKVDDRHFYYQREFADNDVVRVWTLSPNANWNSLLKAIEKDDSGFWKRLFSDSKSLYITDHGKCYHRGSCSFLKCSIPRVDNSAYETHRRCEHCKP